RVGERLALRLREAAEQPILEERPDAVMRADDLASPGRIEVAERPAAGGVLDRTLERALLLRLHAHVCPLPECGGIPEGEPVRVAEARRLLAPRGPPFRAAQIPPLLVEDFRVGLRVAGNGLVLGQPPLAGPDVGEVARRPGFDDHDNTSASGFLISIFSAARSSIVHMRSSSSEGCAMRVLPSARRRPFSRTYCARS